MSLRPDDRDKGRSRSKSRERSRSRDARAPSPNPKASKDSKKARFAEETSSKSTKKSVTMVEAPEDEVAEIQDAPRYDTRAPKPSTVAPGLSSLSSGGGPFGRDIDDDEVDDDYAPPRRAPPAPEYTGNGRPQKIEMPAFPTLPEDRPPLTQSPTSAYPPYGGGGLQYPDDQGGRYTMMPAAEYAYPDPYRYAPPPENVMYSAKPQYGLPAHVQHSAREQPHRQFSASSIPYSQSSRPQMPPEQHLSRSMSYPYNAPPADPSYSTQTREPPQSRDDKRKPGDSRKSVSMVADSGRLDARGSGLTPRMDRLSVSGNRPDMSAGGAPPASPLLEAYQGTYQQMPSPMMLPADAGLDDLPPLSPITTSETSLTRSTSKAETKSGKKRVQIYDAEGDAEALAAAMGSSTAKSGPLLDILPGLTHDQLLKLRDEYKKRVKVQGRGVNIAKHIKMKTTGNFGKICYVTALGRWESESYWANFWYQSRSSSRELLIEALMGRGNAEIREIKDRFRDKRYDDSLELCMEKELKPDKFRTAVLMALEGKRQEETDPWPTEHRNQDVEILHRALTAREGGETAILQVVVKRSDGHLRDVLKTFERMHGVNFAKEALKKSNNLVGEVIAHILNGAINRPARDSLLLRHAIEDISARNKAVEFRHELLMSRLVRLHWDRLHLAKVKSEYKRKYQVELEEDIEEATKGDFGVFCLKLCEA